MRIERTAVYNLIGVTAQQKSVLFEAVTRYQKNFASVDRTFIVATELLKQLAPTDEAPEMDSTTAEAAIAASSKEIDDGSSKAQ